MLRNHSIMSGKAPKAHEISVFGVLTTLRNQQVMCSNHTTSSKRKRDSQKAVSFPFECDVDADASVYYV